ncbi:MAG: ankyrin repeat domain-containing protein [Proteobacteria bacterium]|nr:ankyrin repeat domain-containing protein [Pseudomonadota bacterium]
MKTNTNTNSELLEACKNGDCKKIKGLIENGADINFVDNEKNITPIYIASQNGHIEAIETLAGLGADVNKANKYGLTPVYIASQNGHIKAIETLARLGADVNKASIHGETPVFIAAQNGHVEAIKTLKELGADVNIAMNNGATPVYIAACNGHVEAIKTLKELGADVNIVMNDGATPVFIAAQNGHVEAIKTLFYCGADVNIARKDGATPVYIASQNGHFKTIETLARLGADVNKASIHGETPVYVAAFNAHIKAIETLARLGADINKASIHGATPVYVAAYRCNIKAIETLAGLGADINKGSNNGATPVYVAALNGHVEVIKTLAELGADVNKANENGETPIKIATMQNKNDAMEALFYLGADTKCLTAKTSIFNPKRLVKSETLKKTTSDLIKQFTNPELIAFRDKQLTASNICKKQKEFYDSWEKSRSDYQESLSSKGESSLERKIFADSNIKNYYENLREELTNNLLFLKFTLFAVQHFSSSVLNRQEIISSALAYAIDKDKTGLTTYPLADVLKSTDPEIIRKLNSISRQDSKDLIELADNLALEMTIQKTKGGVDIVDSGSLEVNQKIINTAVDLQEGSQSQIEKLSKFEHRSKASQQFDSFKSAEPPLAYQPLIKIEESSDQQVELHLRKMAIFDAKNIWDNLSKKGIEGYSPTAPKSEIASNIIAQILAEQSLPSGHPTNTKTDNNPNPQTSPSR